MTKHLKTLLVAAVSIVGFGLAGCGSVDSALDCNAICDRYASCYDTSYDTSACADRCRNNASNDTDYKRKADTCNACISDRACTNATFSCAGSCGDVVP